MKSRHKKIRNRVVDASVDTPVTAGRSAGRRWLIAAALGALLGVILTFSGYRCFTTRKRAVIDPVPVRADCRTLDELLALDDEALAKVGLLELNLSVAREIPQLATVTLADCEARAAAWANLVERELAVVGVSFPSIAEKYNNDPQLCRMAALADILDTSLLRESSEAADAKTAFDDPAHLFVAGAVANGVASSFARVLLYVDIGRRLGWPVGVSVLGPRWLCRLDDGEKVYNIESPDTQERGFALVNAASSSSLTHRELLGLFLSIRARYYAQSEQLELADRDILRAHLLYPDSRVIFRQVLSTLGRRGQSLYSKAELAAMVGGFAQLAATGKGASADPPAAQRDPQADIQRVMEINEANRRRMQGFSPSPSPSPSPSLLGPTARPGRPTPPMPGRPQ